MSNHWTFSAIILIFLKEIHLILTFAQLMLGELWKTTDYGGINNMFVMKENRLHLGKLFRSEFCEL